MVEITSEEQNKVKRMKSTKDSLRDLWDSIKYTNIQITGLPEEKERVWENFWRHYSWKFPQHGKGNSQLSPTGTKSPIQDKPKEKHTNSQIRGVPEEEEKKKMYEKIFEEIIVENFPNMEKEIVN